MEPDTEEVNPATYDGDGESYGDVEDDEYDERLFVKPVKTKWEEFWTRLQTTAWTTFYVAAVFFVDSLSQSLVGSSLPAITIPTDPSFVISSQIVTAFVGYMVAQISKAVHNYNVGEVY